MDRLLQDARQRDKADLLRAFRDCFWIPPHGDGEQAYFCGHSLGLQPKAAEIAINEEMRAWRDKAVSGHFRGNPSWIDYDDFLRDALADLAGAHPDEVAVMNTLTVNLHLMMVSFFRPQGQRRKILIEKNAFPSDRYTVVSQLRCHGLDPEECLLEVTPQGTDGEFMIEESTIEEWLQQHGDEIALVLWPGVQYISGQAFDLRRIADAAHRAGARVGFDLAHAIGNIPLELHDSACDFAAWCNYKYLNGGPGAIGGCFVHQRHHGTSLPRLEGWWGNDAANRFLMAPEFTPAPGAEAWQMSNPPILAMAPLKASLKLFQEAGLDRLRAKSLSMTAWLQQEIEFRLQRVIEVITTSDAHRRGCQLSLRVRGGRKAGRSLFQHLEENGVICDWREPDVIRIAPVPMYNRHEDLCRFINGTQQWASLQGGAK